MNSKSILVTIVALLGYVNAACNKAFYQCGGTNFKGENCCVSGYYCKKYNNWFSQCVPGSETPSKTNGAAPTIIASKPTVTRTIFIAGDSTGDSKTANNGKTVGWGKFLSDYVTCNVSNQAKSGRSARTFWREGKWNNLINGVKEGDYVFIQFGHNDGGGPTHEKERGCANGTGNETVTVTLKSGEKEVVHTFPWYIRQMANQVLAKKAHPILLTQTPHKVFKNGKIEAPNRFHDYMIMVAKELNIPCINMYKYIARQYESLGEAYLNKNNWFPVDYLHPSPVAADFDARLLVNAFSKCEPISELVAVLNDKGDRKSVV